MSVFGLIILLWPCIMFSCVQLKVFDPAIESDLNTFIQKTMDCRHVPGLTISVVKGSETWAQGFGTSDFSTGRMVDNSTLFNIGSVTKSFTMTLLGILLTEKNMDWNAKVIDILGPNYGFTDEYRTREMMLRDLLSHRTGLARLDMGLLAGYSDRLSRESFCMKMKYLPEEIPFRDGFIYNNYMFMMLGHVAEKLGGDTWENLVTSKVFKPIGMTSTRILKEPNNVVEDGVARPYIFKDNKFQNGTLDLYSIHPLEPAGAILSNGEDMAKYLRFNLKHGATADGTQLLDLVLMKKAFETTTPTTGAAFMEGHLFTAPEFPISDTPMGYGHAWFTSTYNGYRRTWHSGGLFSYITLVWMFPDLNIGIFASVNGPGFKGLPIYALSTILYYISDTLIGEQSWLNVTTTCEYPNLWRHKVTNSTPPEPSVMLANPSEYVGYYGSQYIPGINVTETPSDRFSLSFQMNRIKGILHSTLDDDRFLMEVTSPWEFMTSFSDYNNATLRINSTFLRQNGVVRSLEVNYEVKVKYIKDTDILDEHIHVTHSAMNDVTTRANGILDGNVANSAMTYITTHTYALFVLLATSVIQLVK